MVYGLSDVVQQRWMIDQSEGDAGYKRIITAKLDAILGLCETISCRRVALLDYFDESSKACDNCDNCITPPQEWDGTDAARKLMSCIFRCEQASGFSFGAQQVIDVLRGKSTAKVQQFGHEKLSTFGIGAELDATQWRSVLRQLVMHGLVKVDHERFNTLRLTAASREVLRGERRLSLRRQEAKPISRRGERRAIDKTRLGRIGAAGMGAGATAGSGAGAIDTANAIVFEALRGWRRDMAKEHGVPAYTIFHDSTLLELADRLPSSLDELREITGIGATKLDRYGVALLEVMQTASG
jgi:ATP-dependent DNA helicase RecQ